MLPGAVLHEVEKIVGAENFFPSDTDRLCYATDSSLLSQINNWVPDLVIRVMTAEQVSKVLKLANEHAEACEAAKKDSTAIQAVVRP
jgi:FAD/FMN-containing dehydrogenase